VSSAHPTTKSTDYFSFRVDRSRRVRIRVLVARIKGVPARAKAVRAKIRVKGSMIAGMVLLPSGWIGWVVQAIVFCWLWAAGELIWVAIGFGVWLSMFFCSSAICVCQNYEICLLD